MNNSRFQIIVLLISTVIASSNSAAVQSYFPSKIVVIKGSQTSLANSIAVDQFLKSNRIELQVYNIDSVDRFEAKLNKLLPAGEKKASQVLEEHITRVGRKAFEQETIDAYQGIVTAVRYDLKKCPAIIFDDSSVIYGVTDLDDALLRYQNWRTTQEGAR